MDIYAVFGSLRLRFWAFGSATSHYAGPRHFGSQSNAISLGSNRHAEHEQSIMPLIFKHLVRRYHKLVDPVVKRLHLEGVVTTTEASQTEAPAVLGIIFLRHAANRHEAAAREIAADQAAGRMAKRRPGDADYIRRRALPLPETARYDWIMS